MTHIIITEDQAKLGMEGHRLVVDIPGLGTSQYPGETIDSLSLFGSFTLSSTLVKQCLKRGVDVFIYSGSGAYFGRLTNAENVSVAKQRRQVEMSGSVPFRLGLAKQIVRAKVTNQLALLQAYDSGRILQESDLQGLRHALTWVDSGSTVNEVIGLEGNAARSYFSCLGRLAPREFSFRGRSRRPPTDAFNSMLSLGYSMLYRNVIGAIERHGLSPYFGFLHADRENHASLASDLMEEWRAVIVDDTVMSLVNDGDLVPAMFVRDKSNNSVTLDRDAIRVFMKALREKMLTTEAYIPLDERMYTFQSALDAQIDQLIVALESGDPKRYRPVVTEETPW